MGGRVQALVKQKSEQVLESEMYNIRVNNSGIVKNPVGLTGRELQADVHLIFVNEDVYKRQEWNTKWFQKKI